MKDTNKKNKFVLVILIILTLIFSGLFLINYFQKGKTQIVEDVSKLTPTPSVTHDDRFPFKLINTFPFQGANYVLDDSTISFIFNQSLSDLEIASLTIMTEPKFDYETTFDKKIKLIIDPIYPLTTNTDHSISLFYEDELFFKLDFKTNPLTTEQINQGIEQQAEDDYYYAQTEAEFYQEYPWYQQLPIVTDEYTIVYDFSQKLFRVRLKDPNISDQEKVEVMNKALKDIQEIGIDVENTPVKFIY